MKLRKETEAGRAAKEDKSTAPAPVHGKWYDDACGAAFAMELIGERWSIPVIRELMLGGRRFRDIRASLPALSAKTLTERLDGLETLGIVRKVLLPPPVSAQIYELTAWGRALEPVLQEMGRWAVRSTLHDPTLPMTPVSLMLSMRTMIDAERARELELWVAFDVGEARFAGRLKGGDLAIHPAGDGLAAPDLRFAAPDANAFLPVFYGKRTPAEAGGALTVEGDPALAQRFLDLFALPRKVSD